jgi:hypothetical protein
MIEVAHFELQVPEKDFVVTDAKAGGVVTSVAVIRYPVIGEPFEFGGNQLTVSCPPASDGSTSMEGLAIRSGTP